MAQRKKDGALIDQLKDMVFALQEENAELLEALVKARQHLNDAGFARPVLECEAAIAKAKGGAPDSNKANLLFIEWIDSGKGGFPDADKLDAAVKAARAAIAKAKGGAA